MRSADDPILREASIVVRPHPANPQPWERARIHDTGRMIVWPARGAKPTAVQAKRDYYDSLVHADGVIGINTSALVESALVGTPSYTLLEPELRGSQEGTLHFAHLAALHVARTPAEHEEQLAEACRGSAAASASAQFVETFLRPRGVDRAAAPILVDELEALAARGPRSACLALRARPSGVPPPLRRDDRRARGARAHRPRRVRASGEVAARPGGDRPREPEDRGSTTRSPCRRSHARLVRGVRRLADYVHYLDPRLEGAVYARAKWRGLARFPGPLAALRRRETLLGRSSVLSCAAWLRSSARSRTSRRSSASWPESTRTRSSSRRSSTLAPT